MILYHSANMERKEQCRLHLNREALLEQLYLAILPRYYSTSSEASKSSSIASFFRTSWSSRFTSGSYLLVIPV